MTTTFQDGQTLYWTRYPAARFTFRHINPDGSIALFGGEKGSGAYRDARPEDIRLHPLEGTDQIIYWAQQHLFEHTSPAQLADLFGLKEPQVRKVIGDRPDIFRRISRGVYEVRDPEADRITQKS